MKRALSAAISYVCPAVLGAVLGCGEPGSGGGSAGLARTEPERIVARLHLSGEPFARSRPKPDFVLSDTGGRPFSFRAKTQGFTTLLLFGYTSCPDVCPVHLEQIASVLRRAPDLRRQVKVVFVAVDPDRDDARRVRAFLDHFDPRFIGLVGTRDELGAAQQAAGVPPAFVDERFEGGYSVSHAAWILVYTKDGVGRLRYPFGTRQVDWDHDLRVLVEAEWPGTRSE